MRMAIVGGLARGIVMVHQHAETSTLPRGHPFQHLEVAVRVAERGNGTAADVLMNSDRLAVLVVNEVEFRQPFQDRLAVDDLVFHLDL